MDNAQRSNAVGQHTSYIPDADPGRQGGNTYTGASTEPTIQDYENFFGPSARDIKTDLQRFKRHGRWHLPDALKGSNPWLTDRIDGLITDTTNSPFTTKILPYKFKDDADGKMKWNVWQFDEGMASRVPYEAAARTLTQSKRSFSGYMVRQGMAISMEHNFMMSPKGRENFKNQLNQLIGSIQYTNDLDVHMALILAPSYQKQMRERYFTLDKTASQICREFVDLFGMMQKNVNALDILIEEGKAVLRTWGGPMPDFLLCNSKLTFQMTMTPEKTNYITQGTDGVKRLRQGPDLTSYRGLSVIHSRSFAMEVGQHPRDILRRRVRTAEYYRISPHKRNIMREFEFYNEERDNWFTLSFTDLLRCARYYGRGGPQDGDNSSAVDRAYNLLTAPLADSSHGRKDSSAIDPARFTLGSHAQLGAQDYGGIRQTGPLTRAEEGAFEIITAVMQESMVRPLSNRFNLNELHIPTETSTSWSLQPFQYDMGIKHIHTKENRIWNEWVSTVDPLIQRADKALPSAFFTNSLSTNPKMSRSMFKHLYQNLKDKPLNSPFYPGRVCKERTAEWFGAYTFYLDMYKRAGFPLAYLEDARFTSTDVMGGFARELGELSDLQFRQPVLPARSIDITCQILRPIGGIGNVNAYSLFTQADEIVLNQQEKYGAGWFLATRFLMTYEMLGPLVREYIVNGVVMSGIDVILQKLVSSAGRDGAVPGFTTNITDMSDAFLTIMRANVTLFELTALAAADLPNIIHAMLGGVRAADPDLPDVVYLARAGISTWGMGLTSMSHVLHPLFCYEREESFKAGLENAKRELGESFGHMNSKFLAKISALTNFPIGMTAVAGLPARDDQSALARLTSFWNCIKARISEDVAMRYVMDEAVPADGTEGFTLMQLVPNPDFELKLIERVPGMYAANKDRIVSAISPASLRAVIIDQSESFSGDREDVLAQTIPTKDLSKLEDVELVIVRPNIEHNMLGIIMGLGGESLGNTLWGQTELSVYDDSMHGIWGMSYKYHERAVVFNERNLIRLWDIAYDGYNGGKDDTYVDWMNPDAPNGYKNFQELTMDVSKNYRGPSMMVMAFVHDRTKLDSDGSSYYEKHFKRNWPSPIVFHDNDNDHSAKPSSTLPLDYDNLQVVDVQEFRVFNNNLYAGAYGEYKNMMPAFHDMHTMRKSAGQASAEAETQTDSLAFQGSMRVKENGVVLQDIQGSGHHGPDYTGVASVRAGKGQKVSGQAPTLHRLI